MFICFVVGTALGEVAQSTAKHIQMLKYKNKMRIYKNHFFFSKRIKHYSIIYDGHAP